MVFSVRYEAFADRNYNADLSLVSRNKEHALLQDPKRILDHVVTMAEKEMVETIKGEFVKIRAHSYCLHGDTPNALEIIMYLSRNLPKYNIYIKK